MNEPSLVAEYFHSCSKLIDATANSTDGFFCIVARDAAQVLDLLSSGTCHGSFSMGTCQNVGRTPEPAPVARRAFSRLRWRARRRWRRR